MHCRCGSYSSVGEKKERGRKGKGEGRRERGRDGKEEGGRDRGRGEGGGREGEKKEERKEGKM